VLFRERGYHGSSMRTLARALRMEAASLYYHFKSKQEILFAILDRTLDDLLAGVGRAVASADGPEARLRSAVRFHVLFHTDSQHEAFLSHSELRSLTLANLRLVLARRDEYERVFRGLLASGVRAGRVSGVGRSPDGDGDPDHVHRRRHVVRGERASWLPRRSPTATSR
jgi:AcrR family transcriptional regulator